MESRRKTREEEDPPRRRGSRRAKEGERNSMRLEVEKATESQVERKVRQTQDQDGERRDEEEEVVGVPTEEAARMPRGWRQGEEKEVSKMRSDQRM